MEKFEYLKNIIKNVNDFPMKGIIFRDITPIFMEPNEVNKIINEFLRIANSLKVDVIVGPESRGFLFGVPLAMKMNKPFVMIRKPGKLPRETIEVSYKLEYGENKIQMHVDSIKPGQRVLIVDDLLATGGTTHAMEKLIEKSGGILAGSVFLIELKDLGGREKLNSKAISLVEY